MSEGAGCSMSTWPVKLSGFIGGGLLVLSLTGCQGSASDGSAKWRSYSDPNVKLSAPPSAKVAGFSGETFEDFPMYQIAGQGYIIQIDFEPNMRPADILHTGAQRVELAGRHGVRAEAVTKSRKVITYTLAQSSGNFQQEGSPTIRLSCATDQCPSEAAQVLDTLVLVSGNRSGTQPPPSAVAPPSINRQGVPPPPVQR